MKNVPNLARFCYAFRYNTLYNCLDELQNVSTWEPETEQFGNIMRTSLGTCRSVRS